MAEVTLLLTATEASDLAVVLGEADDYAKPGQAAIWRTLDGMRLLIADIRGKERPAVIECTLDPALVLPLIEARLAYIYGDAAPPPEESSSAWLKHRILVAEAVKLDVNSEGQPRQR